MLAACGSAAPMRAADPTPTAAAIDLTGWTTAVQGVGPHADFKSGQLELTLPWGTHYDQSGDGMSAKMIAPCQLSGDFQITIHYKLVTWPLTNGTWIGIGAGPNNVARVSFRDGWDNNYATTLGGAVTKVATTDTSGTVRLTRSGATLSGSYQNASGAWTQIASAAVTTDAMPYAIQEWTDASFGRRDVVVDVDKLTVVGTKINCS